MAMPLDVSSQGSRRWTAADLERLPDDGNRYEVVDGELLVTPAPSRYHQRAVTQLGADLIAYFGARGRFDVLVAPADVAFAEDSLVQPDVLVTPVPDAGAVSDEIRGLLLAVEVLSPSSARADRQVKRRLYQREAVPEYWIVDLDARLIERWRPDDVRPEVAEAQLEWMPPGFDRPFVLDVADLFARVWRD
jgi:Uma2 family endonuclease